MKLFRIAGLLALSLVATAVLIVAGIVGLIELGGRPTKPC